MTTATTNDDYDQARTTLDAFVAGVRFAAASYGMSTDQRDALEAGIRARFEQFGTAWIKETVVASSNSVVSSED